MAEKVRIGFIGAGGIARAHIKRLMDIPEAEVVAFADPSEAAMGRMRTEYPHTAGIPFFSDYRQMLGRVPMDAVEIHTPHTQHFEQGMAVLSAGKHLLMEKPRVCSVPHAHALIEAGKGKVFMVSYQRHFQGPYVRVREGGDGGNLVASLRRAESTACLCKGYPDGFFAAVASGKRLRSVNPYAAQQAGQTLPTRAAMAAQRALSAEFTGAGWRSELGDQDTPLYSPHDAGRQLAAIASNYAFTYFEHWQTDLLGHHRDLAGAVSDFAVIDGVIEGLLSAVDLEQTLILVGSDHGNVE